MAKVMRNYHFFWNTSLSWMILKLWQIFKVYCLPISPATAEPSLEITYIQNFFMWPADRLFDKMKNLVEQPLQRAPEMQNLVSMETVRVISCQTFERELLWKVSFHHQKPQLHCSSSLGSRGPGCPPKSQPGWQAWWEPEKNLRLYWNYF